MCTASIASDSSAWRLGPLSRSAKSFTRAPKCHGRRERRGREKTPKPAALAQAIARHKAAQQPFDALRHEPRLPGPHHRLRFTGPAHDLGSAAAVGGGKNNLGAPHVLLCGALRSATIASSRRRSARVTLTTIPALIMRAWTASADLGIVRMNQTTSNCRGHGNCEAGHRKARRGSQGCERACSASPT